MREKLISELSVLKIKIQDAENAVFVASSHLRKIERSLVDVEDLIIMGKLDGVSIDGIDDEIRAVQMRDATTIYRMDVNTAEGFLEANKLELANLKTELRINLALVELVKGVV